MKTISTYTLGCKVNQYDTEAMLEAFEREGYVSVSFGQEADICLINTCTVTSTGDQKSLKTIRRAAREHPDADIIVAGCLAQREGEQLANMDNVRLVIGSARRNEVVSLYEEAISRGEPLVAVEALKGAPFEALSVARHEGRTRAVMKIQEGCDRFCSYCIIPSVRGSVRSMPLDDVRAEAERLAGSGYRELVVTGIHLASYGHDLGVGLVDALRAVHDVRGIERVRLGSLEPLSIDDAFIDAARDMPKLCPQFHVALQSGCDAVLAFGWWKEGMDNGYPDYSPDDTQGGDAAWKRAITEYRDGGGRLLLYFNGRLIDVESEFYRSGGGSRVANRDNTGREFTEHYKFTGEGTTLGYYDSRTFVVADMSKRQWRDMLLAWADRAVALEADAVFYDQLGAAEEFPSWDTGGEFPVQDIFTGRYKAEALKEIRDHVKAGNPEFALGTEWLSDCTSQFCDFVHIVEFTALPESFPEWFRYTFPEVVWSDRCVRDDNDVPRRVGNTLLKGLRNDIEVFRCRGLIDETPVYRDYLSQVNAIRHEFPDLLLEGRYTATDGFSCSNPGITARSYTAGERMAVVAANTGEGRCKGKVSVPGYKLTASRTLGGASVSGQSMNLPSYGIAVLIFERT